jgi:hypothetical protein
MRFLPNITNILLALLTLGILTIASFAEFEVRVQYRGLSSLATAPSPAAVCMTAAGHMEPAVFGSCPIGNPVFRY